MENYVALPIWHKELNAACQLNVQGFRITPSYEQHYLQYVLFQVTTTERNTARGIAQADVPACAIPAIRR